MEHTTHTQQPLGEDSRDGSCPTQLPELNCHFLCLWQAPSLVCLLSTSLGQKQEKDSDSWE